MNYRHLLPTLLLLLLAPTVRAIKAYPYPITVTQGDGTTLTVLLRGDEFAHFTLTEDGYPLYYNAATACYEYATLSGDTLAGSGIIAANATERTAAATVFLQTVDPTVILSALTQQQSTRQQVRRARSAARSNALPRRGRKTGFPLKGTPHSLVILVEFSDSKFTLMDDPKAFYTSMLNDEGFTYKNGADGSARDFYVASSSGVFQPTFDVVGPVTVSQKSSYYGANDRWGYDYMDRLAQFVQEAVEAADSLVDYTQYDYDNDGIIDNVYFFYAGRGEADSGIKSTIWPYQYSWQEHYEAGDTKIENLNLDGKNLGTYACSQEVNGKYRTYPAGIGTFVHEFGHVLGLADHYNAYDDYGVYDPGEWDTMASASYNNNGNTPPLFTAFERYEVGWLDYTELSATTDTTVVLPELNASNMAYRISVPGNDDEYFILENRQQAGWDAYLPGHGMLVWHIDYDQEAWDENDVNNTANHQRVDIVEADGKSGAYQAYAADPFPGTKNVTQFTFTAWDSSSIFAFSTVKEADGIIRFGLVPSASGISAAETDGAAWNGNLADLKDKADICDLQGRRHTEWPLKAGIYVVRLDGKTTKIVVR